MQNETTLQNNETIEIIDTLDSGSDNTSLSSDADISYENDSAADTSLSSTDTRKSVSYDLGMDGSDDTTTFTVSGSDATTESLQTQIDYSTQLEEINTTLSSINGTLAIIMFFIIFAWCENKIRNAVRSFSGVGLK